MIRFGGAIHIKTQGDRFCCVVHESYFHVKEAMHCLTEYFLVESGWVF